MMNYPINYECNMNDYNIFNSDIELCYSKIDLSHNITKPFYQGKLSTCAACSVSSLYDYFYFKSNNQYFCSSPMYLYFLQKNKDKIDDGLYIAECLKSLKNDGICSNLEYPIQNKLPIIEPNELAVESAINSLKINEFFYINKLGQIHQSLIEGYPVVIGTYLYDSFNDINTYKGGKISLPLAKENKIGPHSFLVTGFIQTGSHQNFGVLILKNSKGKQWGNKGYCYMPYEYFKQGLVFDAWTVR